MADEEETEAPEEDKPKESLKKIALRGSMWQLLAYFINYGLRFISSTVLRGLLFPEAFGIMEIILGVQVGLLMLSDVGIQQAIVRSERGDEPIFLDTAWTLHVVRGIGLWLVACAITIPTALITDTPEVNYLLPVASLSVMTMGFHTTAEFTLKRRVDLGKIVVMEATCQLVTICVSVTWAYIDGTVWALVAGGLTNAFMRLAWSFYLAKVVGHFNKFAWDPDVRKEIWDFGKWITGSTAVTFAGNWGDRLMLVAFLGTAVAGIYGTAVLLADALWAMLERVVSNVFYPLFARVGRESTERLREVYYRSRLRFDALTMVLTGGLMLMGPWAVELLFDERYADAGWMLRLLCIRSATLSLTVPAEVCLTSLGHSRYGFYQNVLRAGTVLIGVPLGYHFGGAVGVVWVTALSVLPAFLALWPKLWELKILRLEREALAPVFFAAGAGLGWVVLQVLPEAIEVRHFLRDLIR